MADFDYFDADITRTELGLPPLSVNDHQRYILGPQLLGGTNAWLRQTAKSPYVDGEVTVGRTLGIVEERMSIEVLAGDALELQANLATLVDAVSQSRWTLSIRSDDSVYAYDCEAADYTVGWDNTRRMVFRSTVQLSVRRQPKLLTGGF